MNTMNTIQNDPDYDDAQREYLIAANDPSGPVCKAAYYSFNKGQEAKETLRKEISTKYNVSEKHLDTAYTQHMIKALS